MIPEKGKTYLIKYVPTDPKIPESTFYEGQAIYTGESYAGEMEKALYVFDIPGEGSYNLFAEEDIVSEVKEVRETLKEVWNGNANC